MSEYLSVIDVTPPAVVTPIKRSDNYSVNICGRELKIVRDVDFGKIAGTKTPVLYKAGAERIVWAYGVETRYTLETAIEDYENGFFFYRFKCEFWKNGMHITDGVGSSNSRERKNGSASGFDVANTCLKIAKKRALVDGAILIGQLSGMFAQDLENENFTDSASVYFSKKPEEPITNKQVTYFYAAAGRAGLSKTEAKAFLESKGYKSAKEIISKDFDSIIEDLGNYKEEEE